MKLYVESTKYTDNVGGYDPEDDWSRDSTSTRWSFGSVKVLREGMREDVTIECEDFNELTEVFVTVAVWSTGDSLGWDSGYCAEAFSVHKSYEDAKKAVSIMENAKGVLDRPKGGYDLGDGYTLAYVPWDGYFESLNYIEICSGIVKK